MNAKPHVILIGFHPAFVDLLDFDENSISLVLHQEMIDLFPNQTLKSFSSIEKLDVPHNMNLDEYNDAFEDIERLVEKAVQKHGHPTAIVGMFEHVTLPAARLRRKYGLKGTSPETARLCRDKSEMKNHMNKAGIRTPQHFTLSPRESVQEVLTKAKALSYPVVIKPRSQAASQGVVVLEDHQTLTQTLLTRDPSVGYQIEEFIDAPIFHMDGVVRNGELEFLSVSEYFGTCYDFVKNKSPLGSATIDDPQIFRNAERFTARVFKAFDLEDSVFHLEAFYVGKGEFVFLEIGTRFGGAGISKHVRNLLGVDLVKENWLAETGRPTELTANYPGMPNKPSGWFFNPVSTDEPSRVSGYSGLDKLPANITDGEIPPIGHKVNTHAAPFVAVGKFLIQDSTSQKVRQTMKDLARDFSAHYVPLEC